MGDLLFEVVLVWPLPLDREALNGEPQLDDEICKRDQEENRNGLDDVPPADFPFAAKVLFGVDFVLHDFCNVHVLAVDVFHLL